MSGTRPRAANEATAINRLRTPFKTAGTLSKAVAILCGVIADSMLCAAVLPTGSSVLNHGYTLETALRQTPNQRSDYSGRCCNVTALAIAQRAMWPDRGNLAAVNRKATDAADHVVELAGMKLEVPPQVGLMYSKNRISGYETLTLLVPASFLGSPLTGTQGRNVQYMAVTLSTGRDYGSLIASYGRATTLPLHGVADGYNSYQFGTARILLVANGTLQPHFVVCDDFPKESLYLVGANFCSIVENVNARLPLFARSAGELTIEYGINRADLAKLPDVDRELMRLLVSAVSK